jgi:2-polyprenyl-6-hydroxyphenyl methylase/3-demethylubiquinone-9 3-methyltransferase
MKDGAGDHFAFGKNWQRFVKQVTDEHITKAEKSIREFMGIEDLAGKRFLDIGCGSGLFSCAAYRLHAREVVSFDFDPRSVVATEELRARAGNPATWSLMEGSVLDGNFLKTLGTFDIVYSWGVLHHTGAMWDAIRNAASLVAPGGWFYIALYNNVEGRFGSRFWWRVKKMYNDSPAAIQTLMEWVYIFVYYILANLLRGNNPFRVMREYGGARGMRWREDVIDWLGGYPYEYASVEEVFRFLKKEYPTFRLENIKTRGGIGNNWFLFKNDVKTAI